jgi:hypothetical protein
MKNQYRVTKYAPSLRDATGAYAVDDWTSRSDIGRVFDGGMLSESEYLKVENSFLSTMENFLEEAGIQSLELKGLESHGTAGGGFLRGGNLSIAQSLDFARLVLREDAWGKLVVPGRAYVHFGYDYYMYIGVPSKCERSIAIAHDLGLFVERCRSPYLREPAFKEVTRELPECSHSGDESDTGRQAASGRQVPSR